MFHRSFWLWLINHYRPFSNHESLWHVGDFLNPHYYLECWFRIDNALTTFSYFLKMYESANQYLGVAPLVMHWFSTVDCCKWSPADCDVPGGGGQGGTTIHDPSFQRDVPIVRVFAEKQDRTIDIWSDRVAGCGGVCKAEKTLFWFKLTHGARGELFWHAGSQAFNDWQLNGITFLVVLLCYIVDDAMCDLFFVASHHSHQTNNEHHFFRRHIRHINFVDLCEKIHFVLNPSAVE